MIRYREEIDGLRAIALFGALCFHAGVTALPGSFIAVDLFFVMSGYLITGIILGGMDGGRFRLARFYERRLQRIMPPLFCMLIVSGALAWIMLPSSLAHFGESLAAVAVFGSNILFANWNNYFRLTHQMTPLLHTWSLGIEEQFYAAFPVLLVLTRRWTRKRLAALLAGVAVLSFVFGVWMVRTDPDKA